MEGWRNGWSSGSLPIDRLRIVVLVCWGNLWRLIGDNYLPVFVVGDMNLFRGDYALVPPARGFNGVDKGLEAVFV